MSDITSRGLMSSDEIKEAVLETLEELLSTPRSKLKMEDHLTYDLHIPSDELSFIFVPELERKLKVRIPVKEWSSVGTIQEAVGLLRKYKC